MAQEVVAKHIP